MENTENNNNNNNPSAINDIVLVSTPAVKQPTEEQIKQGVDDFRLERMKKVVAQDQEPNQLAQQLLGDKAKLSQLISEYFGKKKTYNTYV